MLLLCSGLTILFAEHFLFVSFSGRASQIRCYYPLMGTLRSSVLDNASASAVMTLARIPLNLVVIAVLLYADALGHAGVLHCASILLTVGVIHFVAW